MPRRCRRRIAGDATGFASHQDRAAGPLFDAAAARASSELRPNGKAHAYRRCPPRGNSGRGAQRQPARRIRFRDRPPRSRSKATSISRRLRGSSRRCRPPLSNMAATGTASSPSAKSTPTTTASRSATGRCLRARARPCRRGRDGGARTALPPATMARNPRELPGEAPDESAPSPARTSRSTHADGGRCPTTGDDFLTMIARARTEDVAAEEPSPGTRSARRAPPSRRLSRDHRGACPSRPPAASGQDGRWCGARSPRPSVERREARADGRPSAGTRPRPQTIETVGGDDEIEEAPRSAAAVPIATTRSRK